MTRPNQHPHPHPAQAATAAAGRFVVTSTHLVLAWGTAALTLGYMLPWAIAATRRKSNSVAIAVVAGLTGWTIVGWFVALVMACSAEPVQQVTFAAPFGSAFPPPGWYPGQNGQPQYWNGHSWVAPPAAQ